MTAPLRLIGYWASDEDPHWPDPAAFVDEGWDAATRAKVVQHLRQGHVMAVAAGFSRCRFCGEPNGSAELTDGAYHWPEGLAHYLEAHGVRLPEEFVQHALVSAGDAQAAQMTPPQASDVDEEWWSARRRS